MAHTSASEARRVSVAQLMHELSGWKQNQLSSSTVRDEHTPRNRGSSTADSMNLVSPEGRAWLANLDAASKKRTQGSSLRLVPMDCFAIILSFLPKRYHVLELPTVSRMFRSAAQHPSLWGVFKLPDLVATSELPVVSKFVVLKNLYSSEKEHREHFWLRQVADGRFKGVKKLELQCASLHERDLRRVLQACPKVTGLDLSHCSGVTDELLQVLAESELGQRSKRMTDAALSSVSAAPLQKVPAAVAAGGGGNNEGSTLVSLSLSFCDSFTGDAFCQLVRSTFGGCLRSLDLSCCTSLLPSHFQDIFRYSRTLEAVDARATMLSGESFTNLPIAHLSSLTSLNVSQCGALSDDGLRRLAVTCPKLQSLNLSSCTLLTDRGVQHLEYLVDSEASTHGEYHTSYAVTSLCFDGCSSLTDSSLGMICAWFPRLKSLSVDRTNASIGTLSAVMYRLPGMESFSAVKCNYMKRDLFRDSSLKKAVVENRRKLTFATGVFLEVAPHPAIKAMHRALQSSR